MGTEIFQRSIFDEKSLPLPLKIGMDNSLSMRQNFISLKYEYGKIDHIMM
ncbi:hypothetical protein J27TS8_15730 [Robertmurraya siralis]|uniref:Uncharacterized protein n=1 Tax=Robertmurraya siralis TaxID=77777 RepID=A0A920BSY9_9BACI|nr:hypothetical protein J27TS8_15730 [Robertmurraya siralis]